MLKAVLTPNDSTGQGKINAIQVKNLFQESDEYEGSPPGPLQIGETPTSNFNQRRAQHV